MPSMLVLVPSYVPQCVEIFNGKNMFHIFHGTLQSGTECQLVYSYMETGCVTNIRICFMTKVQL